MKYNVFDIMIMSAPFLLCSDLVVLWVIAAGFFLVGGIYISRNPERYLDRKENDMHPKDSVGEPDQLYIKEVCAKLARSERLAKGSEKTHKGNQKGKNIA